MAAVDGEAACAVVATAADIICSLRGADLAGWTPPWRNHHHQPAARKEVETGGNGGGGDDDERELAWPAVARGKRSRSARRGESPSASGSAASVDAKKETLKKKKARRGARGSPASPMDYSGGSGSGSGASTSGGEDGAFCSSQPEPPPPAAAFSPAATAAGSPQQHLAAPPPPSSKVGGVVGRRTILPVPPSRPAGQRARKKMRLPEIQQMVRSLSVESDALRKEMKALQRACTALSQENGKLETRLDQSISMENKGKKPQPEHQHTAEQEAPNGFVLPDLNLPADV